MREWKRENDYILVMILPALVGLAGPWRLCSADLILRLLMQLRMHLRRAFLDMRTEGRRVRRSDF